MIPILILVVIAIPSFKLLNWQLTMPKSDITIKVTGKQWFWSYDYSKEEGDFGFDALMKQEKDLKADEKHLRLLAVDNEVVVPIGKTVRLQITSADVIHSFVLQSFGVRLDAVPGRLNETWFKAEKVGIYYGQCSKLCGKDHAFMPIAFRAVSEADYLKWREDLKQLHATKAGEILRAVGYDDAMVGRVRDLIRKRDFPRDAEGRVLEDALCLTFLESQFEETAGKVGAEKMVDILRKTWRKMTPVAQQVALAMNLTPAQRELIGKALE